MPALALDVQEDLTCGGQGVLAFRSLSTAVNSYNALVGSLESRVLPQLKRLEELGIVAHGTQLPQAQTVEAQPRPGAEGVPAPAAAGDPGR